MKRNPDLSWECGYSYLTEKRRWVRKERSTLLESYPTPVFKVGATRRPWKKRRGELWREGHRSMATYATIVPFELEQALHAYYDHIRVRRQERQKGQRKNAQGERFRLSPEETEHFKETATKVERWVLVAVEAQLELEIMRMEATLSRMQA